MMTDRVKRVCEYCLELNNGEPLNMDDIDEIYKGLKEFNGEVDNHDFEKWRITQY